MNIKFWSTTALLALNIISVRGWADGQNDQSAPNNNPYIDPAQDCMSQGMTSPPGKDFRYLYSKDCKVVYVLPPPVMAQNIKSEGINLQACVGLKSLNDQINQLYATLNDLQKRLGALEDQLDDAKTATETARIQTKIDALTKRITGYEANVATLASTRYDHFGKVAGLVSSVTMVGNVNTTDLNYVRGANAANLHRKTKVQEKDASGKVTKEYYIDEEALLRSAPIMSSIFSFIYKTPGTADPSESEVVSTDIPGVEMLSQPGAKTQTIHVRANDVVSGQLRMSLVYACEHTKPDTAPGSVKIDEDTDPLFTVNRTFEVQEMFGQGYTASLKIDKAVEQISKTVITDTDHGFKKSIVFLPTIQANVDQLVDFKWDTEFAAAGNVGIDKILEIKQQVAVKFVDDYIEKLVQAKLISIEEEPNVPPANGGTVDDVRTANRCWTERDGGLSGWIGGRHTVCGDYQYVVKVWHDGITSVDLDRTLTLKVDNSETMKINMTAPFSFTTAFVKNP
jgi:prefoldin subunit 5